MTPFKIAKGTKEQIPSQIQSGYVYFTTDENKLYVDIDNNTRVKLNAAKADTIDASGVYFEDGQTFQEKYNDGQLTGPGGGQDLRGQLAQMK